MKTIPKLILVFSIIAAVSSSVFAEDVPTDKKAEFRKLVIERNQMNKELHDLDKQAAELLKQGKDTTKINSKQVTVQDQMDLNQLMLETMAARYDLVIPELPDVNDEADALDAKKVYGSDAFERGRARTMTELKRQTFVLLKSIDYTIILSKLKEK